MTDTVHLQDKKDILWHVCSLTQVTLLFNLQLIEAY